MIALAKPDNSILDTVIHGDCIEVLQGIESNSLDCCVVDPPYGLGEVKDIAGLLNAWLKDEDDSPYIGKSGFMGKEWDAGVPSPRYWREVYRVLKPGAHILCFAGTRTVDLMILSLRLAHFQHRDTLMWVFGSGFPKSTAIDKQIDKHLGKEREVTGKRQPFGRENRTKYSTGGNGIYGDFNEEVGGVTVTVPATPDAEKWEGWGTALKPSYEPIILARKPISEKNIAENVLKWGVGGINIDDCRVGTHDYTQEQWSQKGASRTTGTTYGTHKASDNPLPSGRWPSHLLLSHSIFCVPTGMKRVRGANWRDSDDNRPMQSMFLEKRVHAPHYTDQDGMEEVETYDCDPSCPILQIDLQSGVSKSSGGGGYREHGAAPNSVYGTIGSVDYPRNVGKGDTGGASRYFQRFPVDEPDFVPYHYFPKASRAERNRGLEALSTQPSSRYGKMDGTSEHTPKYDTPEQNNHPTVKPTALVSWLCTLVCPPGGVILDPFGGSGTTGVCAVKNGFHYILVEQDENYVAIANARINHAKQHAPQPVLQEEYECAPDCPIRILGEQSGEKPSSARPHSRGKVYDPTNQVYGEYKPHSHNSMHTDTGTAARYFQQFPPDSLFAEYEEEGL